MPPKPTSLPAEWGLVYKPQSAQFQDRLVELGMRFDCYFTCEEFVETLGAASWFETLLPSTFEPTTRAEMMEGLGAVLPGYMVTADQDSPAVIRIRDGRLTGRADYGLDQTIKASFSGSPVDLLQWLENRQLRVASPNFGIISSIGRVNDGTSPLAMRNYDGSIRRMLTAYLPLSNYQRVLWIARSSSETGKLETLVRFGGQRFGKWFRPKTPPYPNTVDFSLSDYACKVNAGRPQQIPAAIRYIEEHLKPGASSLQVRWAMLYLGREKAQAGIPVLLRHIDFLYTPWGVVREAYPAVRALAEVGPEGATACLQRLPHEADPLRRKLLCQVILDQQGAEKARKTLADFAAKVVDAEQRGRLVAAEKVLAGLEKE